MRYSLFISAVVLAFCSCADNSKKDLTLFKATLDALEKSNKVISDASDDIRKDLISKLSDPRVAYTTAIWQPKAEQVSKYSFSIIKYIDSIELQLFEACGATTNNRAVVFNLENKKAVNEVFFEKNKGGELQRILLNFVDSIRHVAPQINGYEEELNQNYKYLKPDNSEPSFTKSYFSQVTTASALSILAKFKNDIRNTEIEILKNCFIQCLPFCGLGYEKFQAIVAQSSNCVKIGDSLNIFAGIGEFSTQSQPKYIVDNKTIGSNEEGVMIYKFKVQSKAGNYTKPVSIEYFKPDGTKKSHTYHISYTVVDPNKNPQ